MLSEEGVVLLRPELHLPHAGALLRLDVRVDPRDSVLVEGPAVHEARHLGVHELADRLGRARLDSSRESPLDPEGFFVRGGRGRSVLRPLQRIERLRGLAEQNAAKAQYLRTRLLDLPDFQPVFEQPFFNEFVLRYTGDPAVLREACLRESLLPGLDLGRWYPEYEGCFLWCATELHTRQMIESLVEVTARIPSLVG